MGAPRPTVAIETVGTDTHLHSASGTTLRFTPSEWAAFRAGVRDPTHRLHG